jgi:NADH:ubiquinone oxidoreductase subunit F (NADH-binding)/NADH:ubiquinone oxidoreductase subunit E
MIVQEFHHIQQRLGYLPESELRALAERMQTPLYKLQEVSSFFPHFRRTPPPEVEVKVCRDMACHLRGSCELLDKLKATHQGESPLRLSIEGVSCLGRCDRAPVVCIESRAESRNYVQRTAEELSKIVRETIDGHPPQHDRDASFPRQSKDPWKIDVYAIDTSLEPYAAVRRFVESGKNDEQRNAERDRIVKSLETAGLLGMGGAGGRAYKKWNDVREAAGDVKYVVCNGDESEPGTFKDRELLLRAPHLVLEGVILAGLFLNAERGYIYIRHEYHEQIDAVRNAIRQAEELHICGQDVLGSGVDFPVEVFVSPGGYICGEQTALIEAIEDKRAEPRNRPPELQTNGLWDKPTLLNNVETLAWVPAIVLREDGKWFADEGRPKYLGRRFFSISGDVAEPGVYEVPVGITVRELINDFAGGMREGQNLKAVALSGPSGGFWPVKVAIEHLGKAFAKDLPAGTTHFDILEMEMDIALARKMEVMMGAGIIVFGDGADMVDMALACLKFFRNESCGKCVPCRIGSQKLVDIATDLYERRLDHASLYGQNGSDGKQQLVELLAETMDLTAICGLGTVAPNPLTSLLTHFPEDVQAYLNSNESPP